MGAGGLAKQALLEIARIKSGYHFAPPLECYDMELSPWPPAVVKYSCRAVEKFTCARAKIKPSSPAL